MAENRKIAKNTMYLYIKTGVTVFIVLYTTRLILQSLGETDFGIFNIVGGVISMLSFLNTSMAITIQRFLNFEQGKNNYNNQKIIFNVGVLFHVAIAIIIAFALIVAGIFLFDGILNIPQSRMYAAKVIYASMIISTVFTVLTVPYDACLNAHENMLYYSIVGIVESILKLLVAFYVVYTSLDKLIVYGILMAIIPLLSMTLMRIYCKIHYSECRVSLHKHYDKNIAKQMISFAGWNLMGTISNYFGNYGNMIVMNHYYGTVLNTVMGIANQIQGQLMVFSTGMLKALNPVIAKEEGAGNTNLMLKYSMEGCKLSYYLLAVLAFPMIIYTKEILEVWLKTYPDWTILFVRLQLVRALLEQVTVSMNKALEAKAKIKTYNMIIFIFNVLPVPILSMLYSYNMAPYWHYIVAITSMVIIPSITKLVLCRKFCNLRTSTFIRKVVFPILTPTILLICIGHYVYDVSPSIIFGFITIVVSSILFITISLYISMDKHNRESINIIICKYVKKIKL